MIQFAIIIAILLAVTVYFLLLPIRRNSDTTSYARNEQNIHFAQERLQELETQLKNGSISATAYEALKQEIEQTLADDLEHPSKQETASSTAKNTSSKNAAIFIIAFIPVAAFCIYLLIGKPEAITYQQQIDEIKTPENIAAILNTIETRLQQHPNDEKGWSVLGNTYMAIGKFDQAQVAYRRLLQLSNDNPHVMIQLADAIAMTNNGKILGEPERLIKQALSINPNHTEALWLAGMAALQNNQPMQAKTHWQKLVPIFADIPAQQQELLALIEQANKMQQTGNASPDNPNQENKKSAIGSTEKTIELTVAIENALQQQVQPNDTIFVFAKAHGENAPKAPLAVKRLTVADLPAQISLSDADAMMPQLTISKFDNIIVNARISKSGNPIAQSGDLQSESTAANGTSTIQLIINKQLP